MEKQLFKNKYVDIEECANGNYTVCSEKYNFENEIFYPISNLEGEEGKWGLCDKEGNQLIEPQYLNPLIDFGENYLVTVPIWNLTDTSEIECYRFKSGIVDKNNKEIIPIKYIWLENIDNNGTLFIAEEFKNIFDLNGKFGVIDINNNIIIPFEYDYILNVPKKLKRDNEFDKIGQIEVEKDGLWGIYDLKLNKEIIKPSYNHIQIIKRNLFIVDKEGYGRMTGEILELKEDTD